MTNAQSEFEEKLAQLKLNYLKSLKEKNEIIIELKNKMTEVSDFTTPDYEVLLRELHQHVHKLAGSSAIFGFSTISEISHMIEINLKQIIDENILADNKDLIKSLDDMIALVTKILNEEGI
jgi:HPt (histidine-containing phosphotransfer) domain-containing protein